MTLYAEIGNTSAVFSTLNARKERFYESRLSCVHAGEVGKRSIERQNLGALL